MCLVPSDAWRMQPVTSPVSHKPYNTPSMVPVSAFVVLFILAFLRQSDNRTHLATALQENTLFRYILLVAFCFNIPRNLVEAYTFMKSRWNKSSLHASISNGALRSLSHIPSSEALSRLSSLPSTDGIRKLSKSIRHTLNSYRRRATVKAITGSQCFARQSYIGKLSITDIMTLFQYASDVNQLDFEKKKFIADQNKLLRSMVSAIDLAVKISRGGMSKGPVVVTERQEGDVDALYFIAVARIFAEWRTIRLVPKGNRAYATSVNLASRDMLHNLSKIEDGVHSFLKYHESKRQENKGQDIPSPTIRQLLEYESDTQVHSKLPRLAEKSVASGLLWTKRQLHYQLAIFRNLLQVPNDYPRPEDAVRAAYKEVYENYHNFALKAFFSRSFGIGPPLHEIWAHMNPPENNKDDESKIHDLASPLSDDSSDEDEEDNEFFAALEDFGKHLVQKWEEILGNFNCIDAKKEKNHPQDLIQSSESYLDFVLATNKSEIEQSHQDSSNTPREAAKEGAGSFVQEVLPILNDFESLLVQFDMNDPTRV